MQKVTDFQLASGTDSFKHIGRYARQMAAQYNRDIQHAESRL